MRLFSKKSMKFLAMFLALTLTLPIAAPAFAWCCPPRYYWGCPPRHYYGCSSNGNSAAWGLAGFVTGVVVGSVVTTNNQRRAEQSSDDRVTEPVTQPLILHKF